MSLVVDGSGFRVEGACVCSQLSQIGGINRFQEPPRGGLFCDLLWADPLDETKEDGSMQVAQGTDGKTLNSKP